MAQQDAFARSLREIGLANLAVPLWGIATVTAGREFYQPDEGGSMAVIVPAFEHGQIVDLVACSFGTLQMRTRKGIASVLGHERIDDAKLGLEPLKVFDDVFTWLHGHGRGVVVLDWKDAPRLLRDVPSLHCESRETADRLIEAFEWPLPYPPVLVSNGVKR
jgi:hypothetical protein